MPQKVTHTIRQSVEFVQLGGANAGNDCQSVAFDVFAHNTQPLLFKLDYSVDEKVAVSYEVDSPHLHHREV